MTIIQKALVSEPWKVWVWGLRMSAGPLLTTSLQKQKFHKVCTYIPIGLSLVDEYFDFAEIETSRFRDLWDQLIN